MKTEKMKKKKRRKKKRRKRLWRFFLSLMRLLGMKEWSLKEDFQTSMRRPFVRTKRLKKAERKEIEKRPEKKVMLMLLLLLLLKKKKEEDDENEKDGKWIEREDR